MLTLMIFFKAKGLQLPLRRGEAEIRVYEDHVLRGTLPADVLIELLTTTLEAERVRESIGALLRERLPLAKTKEKPA